VCADVIVVNPNSTQAVTDGIRDAVALVPGAERLKVDYLTLAEGPPGIETDAHVEAVISPLLQLVKSLEADADAFVIACFSDPGIERLRAATGNEVYGIGECAYRAAAADGRPFGVISIVAESVPRHLRHLTRLGLAAQLAGDRPLGLSVVELADAGRTRDRLGTVARALLDEDGAQALILGCAGMAGYREALEDELGCPIIDPCQAAIQAVLDI
jgi:Asp/Glu/hydantoin racemase